MSETLRYHVKRAREGMTVRLSAPRPLPSGRALARFPASLTARPPIAAAARQVISQNLDQQLNSTEMGRGLKHTIQEHVLPATQAGVEKLSSGAAYLAKDVGERLNQSQYAREVRSSPRNCSN